MKRIYLGAILALYGACAPETPQADTATLEISPAARLLAIQPGNPQNPFDAAGQLHNTITYAWQLDERTPGQLEAVLKDVEELAVREEVFHQLAGSAYVSPSHSLLKNIMDMQEASIGPIITKASMSPVAGKSLEGFIHKVMELDTTDLHYRTIYSYIVEYEDNIMKQDLTERDRKVMLLTASVARHASYLAKTLKRKPRDRDWDLVVANIVAATEGATQGSAQAVILAATAGILSNYEKESL